MNEREKLLPQMLYKQCNKLFLDSQIFNNYDRVYNMCYPRADLNLLAIEISNISKSLSPPTFIAAILSILVRLQHQEHGYLFPIFIEALRDTINEDDIRYDQFNKLHIEIKKHYSSTYLRRNTATKKLREKLVSLENKTTKTSKVTKQKLVKMLNALTLPSNDSQDLEELVQNALKSQMNQKKAAAFLVHGQEFYGQKILMQRLLASSLKKYLNNDEKPRETIISIGGFTEVKKLWYDVAQDFGINYDINLPNVDVQNIIDKIIETLDQQNVIFIFTKISDSLREFIPQLIEEFWQRIVERANSTKNYLIMFLVDYEKIIYDYHCYCVLEFNHPQYPTIPLNLLLNSCYQEDDIKRWIRFLEETQLVSQNLFLTDELLRESKNGIPELLCQKICQVCNYELDKIY